MALWAEWNWQPCHVAPRTGAPVSTQAAVVVGDDVVDPAQLAGDEPLEERPLVELGLGQGHRHAQNPSALVRADTDGREHGDIAHDPAVAHRFIPGAPSSTKSGWIWPDFRALSESDQRVICAEGWIYCSHTCFVVIALQKLA